MEAAANNSWEAGAEAERVWASILSQSATGELIGMMNFASLVDLYEDAEDKIDALEHAFIEKGHARAFQRLGREMGVPVTVNLNAPYWKRIRSAFLKSAGRGDFTACLVIQELMLEFLAVSRYGAVARVAPGKLGRHTRRSPPRDRAPRACHQASPGEFDRDPSGLQRTIAAVHEDVMPSSRNGGAEDIRGDCETVREDLYQAFPAGMESDTSSSAVSAQPLSEVARPRRPPRRGDTAVDHAAPV